MSHAASHANYNITQSDSQTINATSSKDSSSDGLLDNDLVNDPSQGDRLRSKIALGVKQLISMTENQRLAAAQRCDTELVPINVTPPNNLVATSNVSRDVADVQSSELQQQASIASTFKESNSQLTMHASTPHEYGARPKTPRTEQMRYGHDVYYAGDTSALKYPMTPTYNSSVYSTGTAHIPDSRAYQGHKYLSYAEGTDHSSYYHPERSSGFQDDSHIRRLLGEMRSSQASPITHDVINDDNESGVIFCTPGILNYAPFFLHISVTL